jgi:hypothetical protein
VTDDSPVDVGVLQLLDTDLTGESTVGLVEDVLGSNADLLVGELAGEGEVEGGRSDDNLSGGVELGFVEVLDDVGDALDNTVPGNWLDSRSGKLDPRSRREVWRGNELNAGYSREKVTYILKLPPTKKVRDMMNDY